MQRCFALLQDISSKGITLFAHATLHDYDSRVGCCSVFVRYLHAGVFCERPATYFWSRRRSNEKSCTRENVFANEFALSRKVPFGVQFPGRRSPRKFHQPRFDIFDLFFSLLRNRAKRKNRFAAWYLNNGFLQSRRAFLVACNESKSISQIYIWSTFFNVDYVSTFILYVRRIGTGYCISFELSNVEFDEIGGTFERLVISTTSNSNDGLFIRTLSYLLFSSS